MIWLCHSGYAGEIHYSFTHITINNGLLSNQINAVAHDDQGFIWIGGTDGLQRYDGHRFLSFRNNPEDPGSLPSNPISQLILDRKNRLWILLDNGRVGIFDTRRFLFREVSMRSDPENPYRGLDRKLIVDHWGNIFLLHRGKELLIWSEENREFSSFRFSSVPGEFWRIASLTQQAGTGDYWLGFDNRGLYRLRTNAGQWNLQENTLEPSPIADSRNIYSPYHLHFDQKGRLWLQSWPQHTPVIYCYDLNGNHPVLENYELISLKNVYLETSSFFESKDGTIWVGGANVFARYNEGTNQFELIHNGYINDRSISYGTIATLHEDRDNNIWVGTNNNGIFRFNPGEEHFKNVGHIHKVLHERGQGSPTAFMPLDDGSYLVSIWGNGLYRYDSSWSEAPLNIRGIPNDNRISIWSMWQSPNDSMIWMSAQPAGIWRYSQKTGRAEYFDVPILQGNTIRQITGDKNGDLWLGMHGLGVYKWTAAKGQKEFAAGLEKFPAVARTVINKITVDDTGLVWFATASSGIYAVDPDANEVVYHFKQNAEDSTYQLPEEGVSSVLEYNDSLMVIGTSKTLHLFNRKTKSISDIGTQGLLTGYLAALEKDKSGHLWISTTSGLYRFHLTNQTLVRFDRQDGIDDEVFTLASSYRLPDGRLLFGGSTQFIVFNPYNILVRDRDIPEVVISGIRVNNRAVWVDSILQRGGIKLRYKENALEIEFSTLQFFSPYLVKYKMEGLDHSWRTSRNNTAVYSYLPLGDYEFILYAEDADGLDGPVSRMKISLTPPFWRAWWFYSLVFMLIATILYFFDRERINRNEAIHQMRTKIADNLYNEVNVALNNINILSEMARLKAGKEPAKAIEYLEQIHTKSQNMINAMDDILWTVDPENDSMTKIVARIQEHVEKLKNRTEVHIDLLVDDQIASLSLDMRTRQILLRLFKGSIHNLLKIGANNCHLHLGVDKNMIHYTIEFDSTRADTQHLNNLLLRQDLNDLLEEVNGEIKMKTLSSKAIINIRIPLEK